MIINSELKYIFIDVPKTATTSIQKWLLENDQNAKSRLALDKTFDCTHIRYRRLEELMGESLQNYKVIAVIRDPYERVYSAYKFYKRGAKRELLEDFTKSSAVLEIKIAVARILPFWLWAIIYPLKKTSYFVTSKNGSIKIDYLIKFEELNKQLPIILGKMGLNIESNIPLINVTSNGVGYPKKFTIVEKAILKIKYGSDVRIK